MGNTGPRTGDRTGQWAIQDTGLETGQWAMHDAGLETGLKAIQDTGLETGQWAMHDAGLETGLKAIQDTGLETGLRPIQDAGLETGLRAIQDAVQWVIHDTGLETGQWAVQQDTGQKRSNTRLETGTVKQHRTYCMQDSTEYGDGIITQKVTLTVFKNDKHFKEFFFYLIHDLGLTQNGTLSIL